MITIAYITCRANPQFNWFAESFLRQTKGYGHDFEIIVIDSQKDFRDASFLKWIDALNARHVAPKPNVWSGPHRLTKSDWWSASSVRNTALCLAKGDYLVCVDDLSVLMPGYIDYVQLHASQKRAFAGRYQKLKNVVVTDGLFVSGQEFDGGIDTRFSKGMVNYVNVGGGIFYGASCGAPLEALLTINGWDEDCDSISGEDYIAGLMLERNGCPVYYEPRIFHIESEELHHPPNNTPALRADKKINDVTSSMAMLNMVLYHNRHKAPNYFGDDGIQGLRKDIQNGLPFPIMDKPQHHWPDSQLISSM